MSDAQTRVKTGIESFDILVPGGFRKNQNIILSGPSGCGKTIFGLEILYRRAKNFDESGVYVSSNRAPDDIIRDCKIFGWDLDSLVKSGKLAIIDARSYKKEDGIGKYDENLYRGEDVPFDHLLSLILSTSKKINATCIIIDSLTILSMNYTNEFYINQGIQNILQTMEESQTTCIIVSDRKEKDIPPLEWSFSSGIILFDIRSKYGSPKRTMQILKLKGVFHSEETYPLELTNNGLVVVHPTVKK